jgi:hypothetical protein
MASPARERRVDPPAGSLCGTADGVRPTANPTTRLLSNPWRRNAVSARVVRTPVQPNVLIHSSEETHGTAYQ